jgi:sarcosine oxidase
MAGPAIVAAVERVAVAVVGAGLLGSAAAWALATRGVRPLVLEQFGLGHARGSSHGATRIFRLSYPDPGYVRMAVAARPAWARLQAAAGEELLVTTGGLDAGPGADVCAAALAECGVAHSWLTAGQIRDRFPGIAVRPGERMLYQPDSGVCLAGRTVAALQRLARLRGADIRADCPVLAIEPDGNRAVVRTADGPVSAAVVIATAGPWSGQLLAGAVKRPPQLAATLQRVRYFRPVAGYPAAWPTLIEWPATAPVWYLVPMLGGAPGIKVATHATGPPVDPGGGPFAGTGPGPDEQAAAYVRERLPGLDPAPLAPETCLYTMTADEDFVLGREGPVVAGAGCSGHAFKFGPLLGDILAALAVGEPPPVDLTRFSLARPSLATTPIAGT